MRKNDLIGSTTEIRTTEASSPKSRLKQKITGSPNAVASVMRTKQTKIEPGLGILEPSTRNIFVTGGGFSRAPDAKQASTAWYRRLAKANNAISPRMIFINDNDVLGMTSILADSRVTANDLGKLLKDHIAQFDAQLIPLAGELPSLVPVANR